jgi:predicted nucleic acid-binding Zn ribbon protein
MAKSIRERVIEEWRGYAETPLTPKLGAHVGDAVRKFLAKVGMVSQLDEQVISAAWREVVGDFIANHSAPDRIQNGVLHIRVTQTTVLFELERNCKARILTNLQERFGKTVVRDLKFRIR